MDIKTAFLLVVLHGLLFSLNNVRVEVGTDYYHSRGYKGQGIICAIIDDVDITLNDFRDPVTHETRVLAYKRYYLDRRGNPRWDVWNKARIDSLLNAQYPYNQFNPFDSQSVFHHRANSHGTIIANIMAGNGQTRQNDGVNITGLIGMAPESKLVIVSRPFDSSMIFIDSVAAAHNMPYAVNISWTIGPEQEIQQLIGAGKPGKAVIAASGNNNYKNYFPVVFAPGDTLFSMTFHFDTLANHVHEIQIGPRTYTYYHYMTSFNLLYGGGASLKTRFNTQFNEKQEFTFTDHMPDDSSFFLRGDSASLIFENFEVKKFPDHQRLDFYARTMDTTDWTVDIVKQAAAQAETLGLAFSWLTDEYLYPKGLLPQLAFTDYRHTMVDFAMLDQVISVGGNYHSTIGDTNYQVGDICYYSGVGPTFDGRLKPDLVAPGHGMAVVTTTVPNAMISLVFFGTSFSAPLVAGACALLLQEDPARDAEEIKSILFARAKGNAFSGVLPNPVWGHGILNLEPESTGILTGLPPAPEPALAVRPNPFNAQTRIICRLPSGFSGVPALRIFDFNGRMAADLTDRVPRSARGGFTVAWNASGLASGVYMARVDTGRRILIKKLLLIR